VVARPLATVASDLTCHEIPVRFATL